MLHFTSRVMRETIEMHLYQNVSKVGGYQFGCDRKVIYTPKLKQQRICPKHPHPT
jgi:hypothetical protein